VACTGSTWNIANRVPSRNLKEFQIGVL